MRQIAEIVGLSEKKLQRQFQLQKRKEAKYHLTRPETTIERLFRQINKELSDMKKENEKL